ncbi:MAG: metallophosphoesterase family protein [Actinomycetota bacterium]|nr:metallophosphoesterase family protein [Actinomycetota bacterium]
MNSGDSALAVIADIHGNPIALEAVVHDMEANGVRDVVCLGDVAAMGPQPAESLRALRELRCSVVMGNADAFMLDPAATSEDEDMRRIEDIDAWCAAQLSREDLDFIRTFEPTVTVDLVGGRTLLCYHGSPRSFDEIIGPTTTDGELDEMMADARADIFAGGHTHFQMYRRHRHAIVLNPGSVGMSYHRTLPFDDVGLAPWAEYAVVDRDSLSITLRRVAYDKQLVADAIERSGMPHSAWLAAEWRGS